MAGTIPYLYDVGQDVYMIDNCSTNNIITHGAVVRIRAEKTTTAEIVYYDIRLTNNTMVVYVEEDVFPDKSSALTELGNRIV